MKLLARIAPVPATALLTAGLIAWFPPPAAAQSQTGGGSQPDLVAVILWTLAVLAISMLVLSLGYLYRRARGAVDEVIPQNVDPYYQQEGEAEKHSTGEAHPELPAVLEERGAGAGQAHGSAH